jgi:hypothetical protein
MLISPCNMPWRQRRSRGLPLSIRNLRTGTGWVQTQLLAALSADNFIHYKRHINYKLIISVYYLAAIMYSIQLGYLLVVPLSAGIWVLFMPLTFHTASETHPALSFRVTEALSPRIRRQWLAAEHSAPTTDESKNAWHYTYTPPILLRRLHRDSNTF